MYGYVKDKCIRDGSSRVRSGGNVCASDSRPEMDVSRMGVPDMSLSGMVVPWIGVPKMGKDECARDGSVKR